MKNCMVSALCAGAPAKGFRHGFTWCALQNMSVNVTMEIASCFRLCNPHGLARKANTWCHSVGRTLFRTYRPRKEGSDREKTSVSKLDTPRPRCGTLRPRWRRFVLCHIRYLAVPRVRESLQGKPLDWDQIGGHATLPSGRRGLILEKAKNVPFRNCGESDKRESAESGISPQAEIPPVHVRGRRPPRDRVPRHCEPDEKSVFSFGRWNSLAIRSRPSPDRRPIRSFDRPSRALPLRRIPRHADARRSFDF